ncbi:hypothetical protein BLNAU_18195 [Blattamonas nauphoetae]|uniref:Uncharacterized protein n=1 Tax=Blattamonas nauphoetae TaxID=2049346 RepID=A0ABQ9X542_9EUKA|nr:hypothetical protein BLNAU_18195 [Blattamonas nauphoetae]
MNTFQRRCNEGSEEVRQMGKKMHRMLEMEGIEDVMEEKLRNDRNGFGDFVIPKSIEWNNLQGMNVPWLWIRILSRQSRSMVATLSFSFASTLARSDSDTVSVFDVAGSDQRCAPLLRRTRLSHSRHPTPFHALSQPIAVLGETHKPTTSLPLSDFLFQHWTISLEVLIQRFPDATNQALFFPGFRQVFQRSGKHTQSLLLQAVLEKLEQRLRVLADEACGTRNVTQTRFLEGVGEQAEWERGVIESAIDTGQLDYAITTIIPRETLCTPKREPDLLHILQLLFSFYKTVNRLTLVFPDDTSFPDEYTWCRRFRPPLTSIRSAVLYAIQDESTTSENVRRLSRFFSFVFMLTDPECIPQHDDSERMLVHSFQSADPSDEIVAVQMREEGFEDRLQALLHKDQEDYAVRELDEMNVGSETSRPCPYFGMRHVGLQLVLSPLLTLALVLTPSSLPSPPLLLISPLSPVLSPSNPSHLSQPTLHSSTTTEADEGRTQLREGLIERGVSLAVVRVSGEPHPIHSAKDDELSSTFDERECLPQTVPLLLQPLSPNPLNTSSDGPFCGVSDSSSSSSMESPSTKKSGAIGIDLEAIQWEMEEKTKQMEELIEEG